MKLSTYGHLVMYEMKGMSETAAGSKAKYSKAWQVALATSVQPI